VKVSPGSQLLAGNLAANIGPKLLDHDSNRVVPLQRLARKNLTGRSFSSREAQPPSVALEVEAQLHGFATRGDVVRPAECGEEVVQRHFISQVDDREAQAPFVTVTVEEVVGAHAGIKQVSRGDALRIVIVVFLPGRGYLDVNGSEGRRRAGGKRRPRGAGSGKLAVAGESRLKLLIGG
jgi:hypothetical protein